MPVRTELLGSFFEEYEANNEESGNRETKLSDGGALYSTPPMTRKQSIPSYDIGNTHFPTFFWGLMTVLTVLVSFFLVIAIILLNSVEYSFHGGQDLLRGQTVDTNLNIIGSSGEASIYLQGGTKQDNTFIITANMEGTLDLHHFSHSEDTLFSLNKEGTLTSGGDHIVVGQFEAEGVSATVDGFRFPDGSVMTTAASVSTGAVSDTDLNLVAGAGGETGSIIMSTGSQERVRIDREGVFYFRRYDSDDIVDPLDEGVVVYSTNATVALGNTLQLTEDGVASASDLLLSSDGDIRLGGASSASTVLEGSLDIKQGVTVTISSDTASFAVSAQSWGEMIETTLPGISSGLVSLNATTTSVEQSPASAGLVWDSDPGSASSSNSGSASTASGGGGCVTGEICVGYAGSVSRWASVSLAMEGVRLGSSGVNGLYAEPPVIEWVRCAVVESSSGEEVLTVGGMVPVADVGAGYGVSLGEMRHAQLLSGESYVVRCGTTEAMGGPLAADRVSLSLMAL